MSDSESYGSAKEENPKEAEDSEEESDDEPLVKNKTSAKKSKAKSPKKKGKKEEKKTKRGRPAKVVKKVKVAVPRDPLEDTDEKVEEEYEVEAIVGHREYNGKLVYKIRWKNYDAIHDTWETYDSLSCPDLLEMYNIKHSVKVPFKLLQKKRKAASRSAKKKPAKKRRGSVSDEETEEENDDYEGDGDGDDDEYEVEKIVEVRIKKDGSREFLVHWKRWSSNHDTWEPEENLSCPELIEKFMQKVENAKNSNVKELRTERKHTERFTLNTHDSGRRLSKRHNAKQRVKYYDAEADDE